MTKCSLSIDVFLVKFRNPLFYIDAKEDVFNEGIFYLKYLDLTSKSLSHFFLMELFSISDSALWKCSQAITIARNVTGSNQARNGRRSKSI